MFEKINRWLDSFFFKDSFGREFPVKITPDEAVLLMDHEAIEEQIRVLESEKMHEGLLFPSDKKNTQLSDES